MRKFIVAAIVVSVAIGLSFVVGQESGVKPGEKKIKETVKVCRVAKMMTMEGGVCQWYCWRCENGPASGEVNACSAGPGGCSPGTFGCFDTNVDREKRTGKGHTIDPSNQLGKGGVARLNRKPMVTPEDGEIIDREILRFRSSSDKPWRKAFACLVRHDPDASEMPCAIFACGREIHVSTPHDMESTDVTRVSEDLPFLVEVTVGSITYLVVLDSNEAP